MTAGSAVAEWPGNPRRGRYRRAYATGNRCGPGHEGPQPGHYSPTLEISVHRTAYEAEARRLAAETVSARPAREVELADFDQQIGLAKAAILKGVDAAIFVGDMKV